MITAPYNFVPLNEEVFYPDWEDKVSHDVPFSDGESGEIEITITAKSPISIRDGKEDEKFCNYNEVYYIPGSSVKGMVRNVLEVMSFSKMSFVDDKTYAVRDLGNPDLYRNHFKSDKIYCGWLRKELDKYVIDDCGHPGRISHQEIDKLLNTNFSYEFSEGFDNRNNSPMKNAKYKYSLSEYQDLNVTVQYKKKNNAKQEVYIKRKDDNDNIIKEGVLVFTGQPTKRENSGRQGDGKGFEFIFFDRKNTLGVSEEIIENFKFAYFDERKTEPKESIDWGYWKERLNSGGRVPIFFRKDENGEVLDFGLSYLYKLPYKKSILDGLYKNHILVASIPDLAETIFGYTHLDNSSLKGRVSFSHFKAEIAIESDKEITLILGTPRASYYPIYVKQKSGSKYKTYMDNNFEIKGWKRYPIHKNLPSYPNEEKSKVTTTFKPLKQGSVFKGKIRFHNLRQVEIGALLSALTFHNHTECFHNIGLAKPYGYGKIELKIDNIKLQDIDTFSKKEYMQIFEKAMNSLVKDWINSEQMLSLLTMSKEQNIHFKYMSLRPENEFVNYKQTGSDSLSKQHYLPYIFEIDNVNLIEPKSLLDKSESLDIKHLTQDEICELDKKAIENNKKNRTMLKRLLINYKKKYPQNNAFSNLEHDMFKQIKLDPIESAWNYAKSSNRLRDLEDFIDKYPNSKFVSEANELINKAQKELEEKRILEEISQKWDSIQENQDIEIFENFINNYLNYPNTKEIKSAKEKISEIKDRIKKEKEQQRKQQEAKDKAINDRQKLADAFNQKNKKNKKR